MSFDMNKLLQQAQQMQERIEKMQEQAASEVAEASAGGGAVVAKANGVGEVVELRIAREAIDPDDPEALADLVLAGVNEAIRAARAKVEAKAQSLAGDLDLGNLGLPGL